MEGTMSRADVSTVKCAGRPAPSLSEFVDQFESAMKEKRELTVLLNKALNEKAALNQMYETARTEIENLRAQLNSRSGSLVSVKEKLLREEYDKKFQELTLEVRRQRNRYSQLVNELKKQLSTCICRVNAR
jgi:chromosome segregation ATPase